MNTNNEDLLLNEENKNNNEQPVNRNEQNNLNANQNVVDNNHRNEINELPYELNNNQQQVNEEQEKKKKKNEELAIVSNPNNNLINNAEKEVVKYDNVVDKKLSNVSKASGLNLKAYFVEENSKEIDEISKGRLGYTNFTFNGNIKEFYSKVYKHVLESNLIARQLASEDERGKYPTFKALSEQFEEFMKATGEELVQRGHLNKYVPFGGLSAKELKDIENSCLLNRPRSEKEAILKNVSNIKGKNFDEVVENGYQKAMETLTTLNGENYQKGQNPNKDKEYLDTSANLIKGMKALRESEKIWNTYIPDFSAPKWKEPIHKHPISNAFRAIKRGFGITFDSLV